MPTYLLNGSDVTISWLLPHAADLNLNVVTSSKEYLNLFLNACYKSINDSVFIIDISCSRAIEEITRILRLTSVVSRPRIVLLSSILTWGGVTEYNITDTTIDFSLRKPYSWCLDEYLDENSLWETVKSVDSELFIVGTGLFYGNSGYDFDGILNQIWMSATAAPDIITEYEIMTSINNGSNSVPMIHFNDYLALIKYLICCNYENTLPKVMYILASDGTKDCINNVFNQLKSKGRQLNVKYSDDKEFLIESIIKDKRQLIWSSNVTSQSVENQLPGFQLQYNEGLLKKCDELWDIYLSSHNLSPCSIIITGSPWSGKTCVSQLIASKLQLTYVDINVALKYLLSLTDDTYVGLCKEMFESVRNEVVNIIEAKVNENKKPGKKGEDVPSFDLNNVEINESIISSINAKLLRQTIAIYLNSYIPCKLKGYVIDVWQSGIIDSHESMYELITWNSEQFIGNYSVESLFEITVADDVLLKRFMDANSISDDPKAKLSKDQQVLMDKFKSTISNYSSLCTKIDKIENEILTSTNSHPFIVDIETSNRTKGFSRISISNNNSSLDIQNICTCMIEDFLSVHGRIGWSTDYIPVNIIDSSSEVDAEFINRDTAIKNENISSNCDDNPFGSLLKINNQLGTLSGDDKIALLSKCNRLELFLQATILKPLSSGFVNIAREKPSDPIKYLADFLLNESHQVEMISEKDNREFFFRVLDDNNVNI